MDIKKILMFQKDSKEAFKAFLKETEDMEDGKTLVNKENNYPNTTTILTKGFKGRTEEDSEDDGFLNTDYIGYVKGEEGEKLMRVSGHFTGPAINTKPTFSVSEYRDGDVIVSQVGEDKVPEEFKELDLKFSNLLSEQNEAQQ